MGSDKEIVLKAGFIMRKLTQKEFQEIRLWMYRNARQLDLALWQYHFEGGSKQAVLSALSFYQNEDGGFGHALEADSWNPNSSPYTTLAAINILKDIGFSDKKHPILQGIFNFLESGVHCSDYGWYFSMPSNNNFAHAPWWTFNPEANTVESIGLTAELAGFIIKYYDEAAELYQRALKFADLLIDKLLTLDHYGDMGIGGYCILLDSIEQAGLTGRFDCNLFAERLRSLVHDSIVRDTSKWVYYSVRPSEYIASPQNRFYRDNEEIVSIELDYLLETRPPNSVWNITWSWFENNERYSKEFAISENWWKAEKTIQRLNFLKHFDRIDDAVTLITGA